MSSALRLLPLAIALLLASAICARNGLPLSSLIDARAASFTLLLPWIALALADRPSAPFTALGDAFTRDPGLLPRPRRACSAARLESLAGIGIATGVVACLMALLGGLNALASSGGQVEGPAVASALGAAVLGPLYALLVSGLVYAPLAARLAGPESGLGEELED